MPRIIILVLDSLGIGASADAEDFGDAGANTLGHIAEHFLNQGKALQLPNLYQLGLAHAHKISTGTYPVGTPSNLPPPIASYASAAEISSGKDTPSGHWEMMGVPALWQWGYFPNKTDSFPQSLLHKIVNKARIPGYLGNCHASGTDIIQHLGEEHQRTGKPIFYTSADSVFQIACHEQTFGLEALYQLCQICREILTPFNIGRVIARPFLGCASDGYQRTGNRHDYSLIPPEATALQKLTEKGGEVIGIGKIADIYAHTGISVEIRASGHNALWQETLSAIDQSLTPDQTNRIVMTNFVDFDALYGHRRDTSGYGLALEEFDRQLPRLVKKMRADDLLIITADHGNDPTWHGTDHTREHVPILTYQTNQNLGVHLGQRSTFADIAQTICQRFDLPAFAYGTALELPSHIQ